MKKAFFFVQLLLATVCAFSQVDTLSYPEERREIRALMRRQQPGTVIDCPDFIAVGPKGDISFSRQQWLEVQKKEKLTFRSVSVVPGTEYIRIYEGKIAVVNLLLEVGLLVDSKEVNIRVRRLEVYHKIGTDWCRVAGQGTEVDETLFPTKEQ